MELKLTTNNARIFQNSTTGIVTICIDKPIVQIIEIPISLLKEIRLSK